MSDGPVNVAGGGAPSAPPKENLEQQTEYAAAKFIIAILAFLGWLAMIGGALTLLFALSPADSSYGSVNWLALGPAFGFLIAGLFMVANAELTRASVDAADHARHTLAINREMLELMRK